MKSSKLAVSITYAIKTAEIILSMNMTGRSPSLTNNKAGRPSNKHRRFRRAPTGGHIDAIAGRRKIMMLPTRKSVATCSIRQING